MRIRTPVDLGALIRERRKALRLDQKALAEKVGVSRQWIVDVEQGKPRLEIGLVLTSLYFISRSKLFPAIGIVAAAAGTIAGLSNFTRIVLAFGVTV